jgi:2'-5' RNA ligase
VVRSVPRVSKERLKSPRARLFVALDLPEKLREGIVSWGNDELRDPALRAVAPESLHVTLAFLGYLPEREIERLGEIVRGLGATAPTLRLENPVAKPSLRRARLFALPAIAPGTAPLQRELEQRLVAERLYKSEKRPFWPHVTVARVKSGGAGSRRPAKVERPPGALPKRLLETALCVRVTLYRSVFQPQGSRYTPLAQVELSRDGRQ